jgi:hypothetical protein
MVATMKQITLERPVRLGVLLAFSYFPEPVVKSRF